MNTDMSRCFYVDAEMGSDGNEGVSSEAAWKTLARVNAEPLKPGDRVRCSDLRGMAASARP